MLKIYFTNQDLIKYIFKESPWSLPLKYGMVVVKKVKTANVDFNALLILFQCFQSLSILIACKLGLNPLLMYSFIHISIIKLL